MAELFDKFCSFDSLYQAYQKARLGSDWKASVQKFEMQLLPNLLHLRESLLDKTYEQAPFSEFELNERGKKRHIKAMRIADRIVQRALCDEVLLPIVRPLLIYDNGASLKGKGAQFTRDRLQCHLEKFIRKHGLNGYVLKIDYSKFFDNIPHDKLFSMFAERIDDPSILWLIDLILKSFETNVGHLTDEQLQYYESRPIDLNTLPKNPNPKPTDRTIKRGCGIGSQFSQVAGVFYLNPIDQYCKTVKACQFYSRYMDDIIVIHEDKGFLKTLLGEIRTISKDLGMFISERKTQITPLRRGFTFMQVKYTFTDSGRITKRVVAKKMHRERHKLQAYKKLIDRKRMTTRDLSNAYQSWRGNALRFKARRSVKAMDDFYNKLFLEA